MSGPLDDEEFEQLLAASLTPPDREPPAAGIQAIHRAVAAAGPPARDTVTPLPARHPSTRRRAAVGATSVAALVAAFLAGGEVLAPSRPSAPIALPPVTVPVPTPEVTAPAGVVEFRSSLVAVTGSASAAVVGRKVGIGRIVDLRSDTLPILPKGDLYEVWFVGPGDAPGRRNRISAGTFHPDPDGRTAVLLTAAVDPAKFGVLSVTAEPGDGNPEPTGPEVLRAELQVLA